MEGNECRAEAAEVDWAQIVQFSTIPLGMLYMTLEDISETNRRTFLTFRRSFEVPRTFVVDFCRQTFVSRQFGRGHLW